MTKELDIQSEKKPTKTFELVVVTRDHEGNPTGKKSITSDSGADLHSFWQRNRPKPKKGKKNRTNKKNLPNAAQANKILKDLESALDAKDKGKKKDND